MKIAKKNTRTSTTEDPSNFIKKLNTFQKCRIPWSEKEKCLVKFFETCDVVPSKSDIADFAKELQEKESVTLYLDRDRTMLSKTHKAFQESFE